LYLTKYIKERLAGWRMASRRRIRLSLRKSSKGFTRFARLFDRAMPVFEVVYATRDPSDKRSDLASRIATVQQVPPGTVPQATAAAVSQKLERT
jgi:hypothetical protein